MACNFKWGSQRNENSSLKKCYRPWLGDEEKFETAHKRLKIDTKVKILVRYCLHFLKNTKKLTKKLIKIFFSKFLKFVSTLLFSISRSFEYFYQRKIIHNIGVCVQNWPRVISFLTHFWSKPSLIKPSHVGNLCLLLH